MHHTLKICFKSTKNSSVKMKYTHGKNIQIYYFLDRSCKFSQLLSPKYKNGAVLKHHPLFYNSPKRWNNRYFASFQNLTAPGWAGAATGTASSGFSSCIACTAFTRSALFAQRDFARSYARSSGRSLRITTQV